MNQELETVEFGVGDLLGIGMTVVVLGIALAYGLSVIVDVESDFTASSYEANATRDAKVALAKIPQKLGLIVTVILAAVILGIITRFLFVRMND